MNNSPLVTYTKLSPNHSGLRTQKIDTITPHCVVGHLSLQTLGNVFASPARQASCNYGLDDQGRVGMYVEERNRSWCTSSNANDQRAVTIEIASDTTHPYAITDKAMDGLVKLCVDICKRNKIPKLLWRADKSLIGKVDLQNITVHRWFANKACPGDYIYNRLGAVADEVNKILIPGAPFKPYLVRVNSETLVYRSGPGMHHSISGVVRRNQVYTIVEAVVDSNQASWGRLKSGAGWLPLNFCTKL